MDLAKPKAAMARLVLLDSAAAEVAFFLALSLVPFVGIAIALVSRWLPVGLSASIGKVLRGVLPAESPVAGEVLSWARSSASKGWLTVGFLLALWSSFRFMSLCIHALGSMISGDVRSSAWTWRSTARSLLLLAVWMVALVGTALFLLVAPSIEHGLLGLPALSDLSPSVFTTLRALLVPGILFGAIYLTYRLVAATRVGSFRVALVALLASLGWIGVSLGFSLAVPVLWGAARLYGTLGSLVLFLIWAYLIAWILLLGGLLLARPGWARAPASREA
ncbi:MAG TPA: YihY/virulence factor BrkB family protein [Thermoanaerobaculia bacterium]|jgi:membrane protein